jgi:hypothetical protein
MRPEPLDREENDGPGSVIGPREWNQKDQTRQPSALAAPVIIQSAAVLEAVKARPGSRGVGLYAGATAGLDSLCARRRPKSTVRVEESLRRGRTKEMTQGRKKALAFVAAIRERKDGADRTKGWDFPMPLPARSIGFGKRRCPILVRPSLS